MKTRRTVYPARPTMTKLRFRDGTVLTKFDDGSFRYEPARLVRGKRAVKAAKRARRAL